MFYVFLFQMTARNLLHDDYTTSLLSNTHLQRSLLLPRYSFFFHFMFLASFFSSFWFQSLYSQLFARSSLNILRIFCRGSILIPFQFDGRLIPSLANSTVQKKKLYEENTMYREADYLFSFCTFPCIRGGVTVVFAVHSYSRYQIFYPG